MTLLCSVSCSQEPANFEDILVAPLSAEVNPYGRVPLAGILKFTTKENCTVEITVPGETPVTRKFSKARRIHELPVLGLYPGVENKVEVRITDASGAVYTSEASMKTASLPATFPEIEITELDREQMEPGFHMVDFLMANGGKFLPYTILFDDQGIIRWFMDMSEQEQITYTTHRLSNGNWLYLNWIHLLEVDDTGKTIKEEQMWGNAGNHEIIEMPNGQLLMGGSKKDSYVVRNGENVPTRFDHVVLWDRNQNQTVKDWDMRSMLDVSRSIFPADYGMDPATDWFHVNSIAQGLSDNSIYVSGRNQGIVKMGLDDTPRWILGPHVGWGQAGFDGRGLATPKYLLTAVDPDGTPYPPEVQQGKVSAPDFDWPMGQHAINVLDNGNLLIFDNGLRRNYDPKPSYSRAVEYAIDEKQKTIRQVWQYGKERGKDLWSPITSDVDPLPQTGNRLITSGNVRASAEAGHAKLVEITYPDNKVVFEAKLFFKDALGTGEKSWGQFDIVFRVERYDLLPAKK